MKIDRALTLKDFQSDYSFLVVRLGSDKSQMPNEIERIISTYYTHVESVCRDWLKTKK